MTAPRTSTPAPSRETAGHTPGPWKTSKDLGQAVVRARGVMVADCNIFGRNAPSEAQCAANARLMAAAPDLATALRTMLDAFGGPDTRIHTAAKRQALDGARAATAKVDGGRS